MSLEGIAKQSRIQKVTKVLEIGLRGRVINMLAVNNLLLGQGDIDRVGNLMVPIILLDDALDQDNPPILFGLFI